MLKPAVKMLNRARNLWEQLPSNDQGHHLRIVAIIRFISQSETCFQKKKIDWIFMYRAELKGYVLFSSLWNAMVQIPAINWQPIQSVPHLCPTLAKTGSTQKKTTKTKALENGWMFSGN